MKLVIDNQSISLSELRQIWEGSTVVELGMNARDAMSRSKKTINQFLASGRTVYGVNTGFGKLASVSIDSKKLQQLQSNLLSSHRVGVGQPLAESIVRLTLALKVISLARGYSGVRPALAETLGTLLNNNILPIVPSQGSVGASGDLAPLAHIACALVGEGDVNLNGQVASATDALKSINLEPMQLDPKEGLALLNGTQISTALALSALFRFEHTLSASLISGAMSTDAIRGSDGPFDARIHRARGHRGQQEIGTALCMLMQGSKIRSSHVDCAQVQDPYSIRCQPQVVGACLDALYHASEVLEVEANAVTDNPLIFPENLEVISGGNFHAEPVALVSDYMALAIAEIGALSERRTALLIDSNLSRLPAFLVEDSGINSGFMMAQITAAALASENKSLAHPSSIDSIPTSANQEDHVSMATHAARRLHDIVDNVNRIIAIELLASGQGIEFHRPLKSSPLLEDALYQIRTISPSYVEDRSLAEDIELLAELINDGNFYPDVVSFLPSFQS